MNQVGQAQPETQSQAPKDLMGFLEYYLVVKAPFQIPEGGKEAIVKYGPWVLIVMMVLMLPAVLVALGLGTVLLPFGGLGYATGFGFLALGLLIQLALTAMALPGLFARKMSGWTLLFYARIVGFLSSALAGAIVGALVGAIISLYVLFQVRPLYKA